MTVISELYCNLSNELTIMAVVAIFQYRDVQPRSPSCVQLDSIAWNWTTTREHDVRIQALVPISGQSLCAQFFKVKLPRFGVFPEVQTLQKDEEDGAAANGMTRYQFKNRTSNKRSAILSPPSRGVLKRGCNMQMLSAWYSLPWRQNLSRRVSWTCSYFIRITSLLSFDNDEPQSQVFNFRTVRTPIK